MNSDLVFHKSSYSGHGQDCVEVAQVPSHPQKSSYSGTGEDCIEVARVPAGFHKSSYSGRDQNCIEIAETPCGAAIRDSKHPDAGHLPFPASEWTSFLNSALK